MIVRTQTMHYQPDWLLEIGLHVYCSLLFLDSNSILAGGYSDCFWLNISNGYMSTKEERNKSMTFQKAPIKQMKLEQKTCVSKKTPKIYVKTWWLLNLNPHLFFSQPGKFRRKKNKILRDDWSKNSRRSLRGHPLRWWCQLRHTAQGGNLPTAVNQ